MEKRSKKSIIIGICVLLLITITLLGLTYAYYRTRVIGNTNDKSVSIKAKKLEVTYQNESAYIETTKIKPGYTATKTFEVQNTGKGISNYSIILDNINTTFTRVNDWTYELKEGDTIIGSGTIPISTTYIKNDEELAVGETKKYTLTIKYIESDEDQSIDMGASLSLRINISDEMGAIFKSAQPGTLLAAIGNDNIISEPLTTPGQYGSGGIYVDEINFNDEEVDKDYYTNNVYNLAYGTGYEFNNKTGLYSLTGVKYVKFSEREEYKESYNEICNELSGKFMVSIDFALDTSGQIYKIDGISCSPGLATLTYKYKNQTTMVVKSAELAPTEDDYGTSYYFRGAVENNYVNYSGMCWRIVRVQGNGTIKLVLADKNGECNASTYNEDNTTSGLINDEWDNYIGPFIVRNDTSDYLFTNTNIPKILSDWATTYNLDTNKLIETEWCNDTTIIGETHYKDNFSEEVPSKDSEGYEATIYEYSPYARIGNSKTANPTLKCDAKGMEGTTGIAAVATKYKNRLGILSADEVAFAGGTVRNVETYSYLKRNASGFSWTTLSPAKTNSYTEHDYGIYVTSGGRLYYTYGVGEEPIAIRPAVVLKKDVTLGTTDYIQDGTVDRPYVIE